jgi:hypothetical protein
VRLIDDPLLDLAMARLTRTGIFCFSPKDQSFSRPIVEIGRKALSIVNRRSLQSASDERP